MNNKASMKKVLVIGAGVSGLAALKCCLEEGLDVKAVERTDDVGGLWNYSDVAEDGRATVMKSTVINTSKELTAFSDFPFPDDDPNYVHHSRFQEYVKSYTEKFNLRKHISFHTEVVKVHQIPAAQNSNATSNISAGQSLIWEVILRKTQPANEKKEWKETFDAILVCTGHHADKNMPEFKGRSEFKGQVIHSHDYRDHKGYEGKRVVIVGLGNSGGDVAVELGRISEEVYLSTRRGSWFVSRIWDHGLPFDICMTARIRYYMSKILPTGYINSVMERNINSRFDHELYGLKPAHRFNQQHSALSDELPNRIISGAVVIKPDVKRLTTNGVEFVDGSVVEDVDVIIAATGYLFGFPFIDHPALEVNNNEVNLYQYVFPPEIEPKGSLAVIGCFQSIGSVLPVSELQARWSVQIIKGNTTLPSAVEMWREIKDRQTKMKNRYVTSKRHTIQVDKLPYQDDIARLIGCELNLVKLAFTDPRLAYHLIFGPLTPFQYRLSGPGAWPGARDAVLTVMDRVRKPLLGNRVPRNGKTGKKDVTSWRIWKIGFWILFLSVVYSCYN